VATSLLFGRLSHAQEDPTPIPPPVLPTPVAACEPYFVGNPSGAPARTCAAFSCAVVATLPFESEVCSRGVADNTAWRQVDLDLNDPNSPLAFIFQADLSTTSADTQSLYPNCQPFLVAGDQANVYTCANEACPIIGAVGNEAYVCVREYVQGRYAGWGYADDSDPGLLGWVRLGDLRPASNYGRVVATPRPVAIAPALGGPSGAIFAPPIAESLDPIQMSLPLPACQAYTVSATSATLRECPSQRCAALENYPFDTPLCVRGSAGVAGWLAVDTSPEEESSQLYALAANLARPAVAGAVSACYDWWLISSVAPAIMRTCPSVTCRGVGTLNDGTRVCARAYGGQFNDWIQIEGQDLPSGVWVSSTLMRPDRGEGVGLPNQTVAQAATPIATPLPTRVPSSGVVLTQEVTLEQLRVRDIELNNDGLQRQFSFELPANWLPTGDSILELAFEYFGVIPVRLGSSATPVPVSAMLAVFVDDVVVAAVTLDANTPPAQTLNIPIPANLLARRDTGRHTVRLVLDAAEYCLVEGTANAFIRAKTSRLRFSYQEATPLLDLGRWPYPFYTPSFSTAPAPVVLVLSDRPTTADIEAGAKIAAGLGATSGGRVNLSLRRYRDLSAEEAQTSHLIYIGTADNHAGIAELYASERLPTNRAESGALFFNGAPVSTTDGVAQIIPNLLNPLRGLLVLTGADEAAVLKAADAFAGVPNGVSGALSFISVARPAPSSADLNSELTLAQLGLESANLTGAGQQIYRFEFTLPPGRRVGAEARFDLLFNVSGLLQSKETSLSILLNDEYPLASTTLGPPEADVTNITQNEAGLYRLTAALPADLLTAGRRHSLSVVLNAKNREWQCIQPDANLVWLNISNTSRLFLPPDPTSNDAAAPQVSAFPLPFNTQRDLSDLWLSLPDAPTSADLEIAYRLLATVAASTDNGSAFAPRLVFGSALPPQTDLARYHFVIVGRPSTNSFLAGLNPYLPQPFQEASDLLAARFSAFDPMGRTEVGLLQMGRSLWNPQRSFLLITGTSAGAQARAAAFLLSPQTDLSALRGDIIYLEGGAVFPLDSRSVQ
jgi:hypothetical protein